MAQDFYRQFGQLMRRARKDADLSQEEVADAIGLTRTSISNIENGRQKVLLHTYGKLLQILKLELAPLIPRTEQPQMGLDRLRSSDESGMKFFERAGINPAREEDQ